MIKMEFVIFCMFLIVVREILNYFIEYKCLVNIVNYELLLFV